MVSDNPLADNIMEYILSNSGKGVRPMTVMLSALLHNPDMGLRTYLGAMLVEMMHTASLVHDDVIDHADTRRGKPSPRALWGPRTAVIAGDFILAKSLTVGLDSGQYDIVDQVVRAMSELCEGELLQSRQSDEVRMTREIYLDIVTKKTAVLFGVSAAVGAMSVGASGDDVARMRLFGEATGIAFQIRDDILDYASSDTGKPLCNDLVEKKITLPLLEVMEKLPSRKEELSDMLARGEVDRLHRIVLSEGGLEAATEVMKKYVMRAVGLLANYPVSPAHNSLVLLANYAGERKR